MPSTFTSFFTILVIPIGLFYQIYLTPLFESVGVFRSVEPLNTEQCKTVEGLQACEKLVVHSSGLVYLACASSPYSRTVWTPALGHLNATALRALSSKDYVATYDPTSRKVTRLDLLGLDDPRGLNVHGMDVVTDEHDPSLVWIYLVNHRPPLDPNADAAEIGADSVIEIFKTQLGSDSMKWIKTVSDEKVIVTPNDIVGSSNGKEFWFTNDHGAKTGISRTLDMYLHIKSTSVGYCHLDTGCKIAADKLYFSNGIVRKLLKLASLSIKIDDPINDALGRAIDNLALANDGSVVVAAFPKAMHFTSKAVKDVNVPSPVSAIRVSENEGGGYRVEKIYESDGLNLGSAATTASMYQDELYLHGLMGHHMLVCKIPTGAAM
ncbi:hypothetical protein RhiJN_22130 [Ceratobasidium sp. AG-Ba]|nr:hypothetical protein RhiJN_22130 [Ceratobasidium sp. AG-Ba]